jgi:heptosyltransferase-2
MRLARGWIPTRTEKMRIVIRAPNWLGDAVMALPAVESVRAHFPDATLAVAAPAPLASLYEAARGLDEIVALPMNGRGIFRSLSHATALRDRRFDLAILLPNSFAAALAIARADIPERWGSRTDFRAPLLTRAVARPRRQAAARHQSGYYAELLRALDIEPVGAAPRIEPTAAMRTSGDELLAAAGVNADAPLLGFAPGAAYGHAKRWPPERFAALAVQLSASGAICVLLGSEADRGTAREIESWLSSSANPAGKARIFDLIGRTDLGALVGLLPRCRAFVTNDSGAMHLAAAAGVPVTAIFGPTDEHATAPLGPHEILTHQVFCRPCLLRECPIDHRCMRGIGVERVREAVSRQLG